MPDRSTVREDHGSSPALMSFTNCRFDEASLGSLLAALAGAGLEPSAFSAVRQDDGMIVVNLAVDAEEPAQDGRNG